jgi:fibronectin type 3 domain-containing protein
MRKISEPSVGRTDRALNRVSRVVGGTTVLGTILSLALLLNPVQALSVTGNGVTLAWDRSPDSSVTGYRIYYGAASGNYTNSVAVGNVTTNAVQGLTGGITYFFAVTAYDASGLESSFSNETSYTAPTGLPTVQLRMASNGQAVLTVQGQIGHTYEIQATQDLKTWPTIGITTLGASGSVDFADTNAASFPKRFYRTRDTQP